MPYIAVVTPVTREHEIESYRFAGCVGTTDIRAEIPGLYRETVVRVWVASAGIVAQNQADRLSSGMFGARVCNDEHALDEFFKEIGVSS